MRYFTRIKNICQVGCVKFLSLNLSEHGLLSNQRYASWRRLLCIVIFQIASSYRNLPDCALGDRTNRKFMLQNACEFGVLRDSDNTCQKLYTPDKVAGLFSFNILDDSCYYVNVVLRHTVRVFSTVGTEDMDSKSKFLKLTPAERQKGIHSVNI